MQPLIKICFGMDSLVSSRVKRDLVESMVIPRERNIGCFDSVLADDRLHRSMDCSFHWKSNSVFASIRLWTHCGCSICAVGTWFVGQLIFFLSHSICNVSSQSRTTFFPSCIAAVLCWFLRRDACLLPFVPLPLLYHGILLSIHSSFHPWSRRVLPLTG